MPIRKKDGKWYWGSRGPFLSREKAELVEKAAYANGYRGDDADPDYGENLIMQIMGLSDEELGKMANSCAQESIAFDSQSVRSMDKDGRLHVRMTPISKATINEYYGSEIVDGQKIGLEPTKKYKLLRDPDELKKSSHTFNNIPLLKMHAPADAKNPMKSMIIGTLGSDANYKDDYLRNSMAVWDEDYIQKIINNEQSELSCSYFYKPDMSPGNWKGETYDGVMRDIVGSHVALVENGRAGHDVRVADSKNRKESELMKIYDEIKKHLEGKIDDSEMEELINIVKHGFEENNKAHSQLKEGQKELEKEHKVIEKEEKAKDDEEDFNDPACDKQPPEEKSVDNDDGKNKDKPEEEDKDKKSEDKRAMDAAIARSAKQHLLNVQRTMKEIAEAKNFVNGIVPSLRANDGIYESAKQVYAECAKAIGITLSDNLTISDYKSILSTYDAGNANTSFVVRANDSNSDQSSLASKYPHVANIKTIRGNH